MTDAKLSEEIARAAVVARDERPDYQLVEEWAERVSDLERRLEAALATDLRCEHCGETYQTTCGAELQSERDELREALRKCCLSVSPSSEISDDDTHGLHTMVPAEVEIGVRELRRECEQLRVAFRARPTQEDFEAIEKQNAEATEMIGKLTAEVSALRSSLCDRADFESLNRNERIELLALRALIRWVMANPSRCIGNCCGELGSFTVYHASEEDEISEDGSGPTAVALADALGLDWREP